MDELLFDELPRAFNYSAAAEDVIRVVVVDSREAMREGLRQMLNAEESIKVIGEARNAKEAMNQIQKICPDIIIMDIDLRGEDGSKIINQIKQASPRVGIIVLNDDRTAVSTAIENGAVGFLPKDIGRNELVSAIRIIYLWRSILFQDQDHFALVKL
jgi:DNA-binding NarL/FixJ family response regulator